MSAQTVLLRGGPLDGQWAEVEWGTTLICEGDGVPEGMIARYRPTRDRRSGIYRFREWDRVVARIPIPSEGPAA